MSEVNGTKLLREEVGIKTLFTSNHLLSFENWLKVAAHFKIAY